MSKAVAAGILVGSLLSTGCVIEASSTVSGGVAVGSPPPAPIEERRPPPPTARAVWVAGYWHWTGMQYTWIPGHWENAPPGAQWHAPRYSLRDGTYFYEAGSWSTAPR